MTFSGTTYESGGWEGRALRRSLEHAHTRSVDRLHRLVEAARDLANETGTSAFTVAQVAGQARVSLKGFYGCFAGKDDLLLALLEEDSRIGAHLLAEEIASETGSQQRLHRYVTGIFGLVTHPGALGYAGLLVREHRRLAEGHPDELTIALAPLVDLLTTELLSAAAGGAVDVSDPSRAASTVFGILLGGINDVTLGRAQPQEEATWLWEFLWAGLRGEASTTSTDDQTAAGEI
jgi:AcrR family transcriptional regulator